MDAGNVDALIGNFVGWGFNVRFTRPILDLVGMENANWIGKEFIWPMADLFIGWTTPLGMAIQWLETYEGLWMEHCI